MKTLEEIKKDPWFTSRPRCIQQAIITWPPNQYYRLKSTGQKVLLHSFEEGPRGKCTTCAAGIIEGHNKGFRVFGIPLADLTPWESA